MPKARARLATAWPMRPMPRMPSRRPVTSWPMGVSSVVSPQRFSRTMRSPQEAPRAEPRMSSKEMSAVALVSTPGVLVTAMPLASACGIDRWSYPTEWVAMMRIDGARAGMNSGPSLSKEVSSSPSWCAALSRISSRPICRSSGLSVASNSAAMRRSTSGIIFRVTRMRGLPGPVAAIIAPCCPMIILV